MKIARCFRDGSRYWAVIDSERNLATPLSGAIEAWTAAWCRGDIEAHLDRAHRHALSEARLLAPVDPTAKVLCFGMNYRSHLEAFGKTMPDRPVAYLKAQTAVIAHDDPLVRPRLTNQLDYEIELVVVMARAVEPGEAQSAAVLGYTIGNDVSARDLANGPRGLDLFSVKSLNGTCGIGPWIVTSDEIAAPPDVLMELRVNGEVRQHERTGNMHWGFDFLLTYIDERTRLLPGDLVFTGTPAGVGLEDKRFLQPGDVIEAEIENIGVLRNTVAEPRGATIAQA